MGVKQKLDEWFSPMLVEDGTEKDIDRLNYCGQMKADGTRVIVENSVETGLRIFSRRGLTYNENLPEITKNFIIPQLFRIDGEVVYIDNEGHQVFQGSQLRCQTSAKEKISRAEQLYPVGLFAFDIMMLNGRDLTQLPFLKRFNILQAFVTMNREMYGWDNVRLLPITMDKKQLFEGCVNAGLEGIVLKKIDGIYQEDKRSENWLKVKAREHSIWTLKKVKI